MRRLTRNGQLTLFVLLVIAVFAGIAFASYCL